MLSPFRKPDSVLAKLDVGASRSNSYASALLRLGAFARDDSVPLLIEGESGTGKTTAAEWIHAHSPRAGKPLHTMRLNTFDDNVVASELFGYVPGGFTGAIGTRKGAFSSAHGGTLVLDEIDKTSLRLQGMLLQAIENGVIVPVGADREVHVDVRVVVLTNASLAERVADGRFLFDLYERIRHFRVRLPPLRERRADIPPLVGQIVVKYAPRCGYDEPPAVHPDLLRALVAAHWPGNVRDLDLTLHAMMLLADGANPLTLGHFSDDQAYLASSESHGLQANKATLEQVREALRRSRGNKSEAARILGVDRKTVRRRMQEPRLEQ